MKDRDCDLQKLENELKECKADLSFYEGIEPGCCFDKEARKKEEIDIELKKEECQRKIRSLEEQIQKIRRG